MNNKEFKVNGRPIGTNHPAFIIAEVSCNHHQNLDEAIQIIQSAHDAGVDAIKIQTYTPDTMTVNSTKRWFYLGGEDTPGSWKGKNLYELYKTAYTPWEWHKELQEKTEELGMVFFSTPFDPTAVDFLESLHVPCYKIASYEATDIPLLKKVASTGKPVIMSVGFATEEEVTRSVDTLRESGATDIAVLHCNTGYAAEPRPEEMHLSTIAEIAQKFSVVAGFSDNNAGIEVPVCAVAMGASIIEKHLILSRNQGGHDARFSIEPKEMKEMIDAIRRVEKLRGMPHFGPAGAAEENYRYLRRSLFVVRDVKKGEQFTPENVRVIRPAAGLEPRYYEQVLGKTASQDIEKDTPLTKELVDILT